MKCEKCLNSGFYGDNGPGRKGNTEYTRCDCQEDVSCTTHHACKCIQERLDKIEAVWREHKHLDYLLIDKTWLGGDTSLNNIFYDLWQAIRREEKWQTHKSRQLRESYHPR